MLIEVSRRLVERMNAWVSSLPAEGQLYWSTRLWVKPKPASRDLALGPGTTAAGSLATVLQQWRGLLDSVDSDRATDSLLEISVAASRVSDEWSLREAELRELETLKLRVLEIKELLEDSGRMQRGQYHTHIASEISLGVIDRARWPS